MKKVNTKDAVGMILCHDITEIVPGVKKGTAFKKGHVIREEDIEHLLDLGKYNIFVWDEENGTVHENEAADRISKAAAGKGVALSGVSEGKINFVADYDGILKIKREAVYDLNRDREICFSVIHPDKIVKRGQLLGGTRVIPLAVKEETVERAEKISSENSPIIEVLPFKPMKIGVVTTGREVKEGRIKDGFLPVLERKAEEIGSEIIGQLFPGDDAEEIAGAIKLFIEKGADMVQVTGGMSVDPDDCTPTAIRMAAEEESYGSPVLPGAMFMLAYAGDVPVVGLPGCVMYSKRTIFDLVVPRLAADEKITREDIVMLAVGGQCEGCEVCTYPKCGFGR